MTRSSVELSGVALHPGSSAGTTLRLDVPLSFWGGTDEYGRIVDRHHPQYGGSVTGRVLVMSSGRGSSSSSNLLAELLRTGNGPAAIVMAESDAIVTLGAIVANELYSVSMPIVVLERDAYDQLLDDMSVAINADELSATVRFG